MNLNKKVRDEIFRGEMDKIVTTEDMARLTRFAKQGPQKEISLIKDTHGVLAHSPEEAVKNLCDAHFPGSKVITDEIIKAKVNQAALDKGEQPIQYPSYVRAETISKAINTFGDPHLLEAMRRGRHQFDTLHHSERLDVETHIPIGDMAKLVG